MGETTSRALFVGVLCVLALSVGVAAGFVRRSPPSPPPVGTVGGAISEGAGPQSGEVEVHVAGFVVSPGVVTVDVDAIVADAIEAAGGLRAGARADLLNLAAPVGPGEQIVVPGPEDTGEGPAETSGGVLSLNQATVAELEELPGVGPVLAERIVAYREENGRFEAVEDLLEVPGIGEAKLATIRDLVRP